MIPRLPSGSPLRTALAIALASLLPSVAAGGPGIAALVAGAASGNVAAADLTEVPKKVRAKAKKQLKTARKLLKRGSPKQVRKAVAELDKAFAAYPSGEFRLELASALLIADEVDRARSLLEGFKPSPGERDSTALVVERIEAAMAASKTQVEIASQPAGAALMLSGTSLLAGETPWQGWLPFGTYQMTVSADGHADHDQQLVVAPGKPIRVAVRLTESSPAKDSQEQASGEAAPPSAVRNPDVAKTMQAGMRFLTGSLSTALLDKDRRAIRRVAVMPFETLEEQAKKSKLGSISAQLLSARLSESPQILQVERAQLDGIVEELQRGEAGQLEPAGAASVGKLVGANAIILGAIAPVGPNYVVTSRVVDTETGVVLSAAEQSFARQGMVAFSEDVIEVKSKAGAAARSAVLPGWGQMYNGDTGRAMTYGTAFLAVAAGAITSAVLGVQAQNSYRENKASTVHMRQEANDSFARTNLLLAGLGAVWAVAVGDAYVAGRDAETINLAASAD